MNMHMHHINIQSYGACLHSILLKADVWFPVPPSTYYEITLDLTLIAFNLLRILCSNH